MYVSSVDLFSFTKICYFKQPLFTETVVLHTLPHICKENNNIKGYDSVIQYSSILKKLFKR